MQDDFGIWIYYAHIILKYKNNLPFVLVHWYQPPLPPSPHLLHVKVLKLQFVRGKKKNGWQLWITARRKTDFIIDQYP